MLVRIKNLLVKSALYIAILCTLTIAVLSLIKMPSTSGLGIPSSDKLFHGIAYFFLALSWLYALLGKTLFDSKVKYAILGCFIYGIIIELLQTAITSYRTASYLDILANSIGIALAVFLFHVFEKKIRLI
jgi:VanZ family protein